MGAPRTPGSGPAERSFQSREEAAQELRKKGSRRTLPPALCGSGVAGGTGWGQRGDTVPA